MHISAIKPHKDADIPKRACTAQYSCVTEGHVSFVTNLLVLPGSLHRAVEVLCVLSLKVSKLLLLFGCLLLQVGYLKIGIPHQELTSLSKEDICARTWHQCASCPC